MQVFAILFVVVCGIGAINSLFLVAYLAFARKGQPILNRLLAALLVTFSLRVAKTVWVTAFRDVHPIYLHVWIWAFLSMGVVFYAYVLRLTAPSARMRWRVPALVASSLVTVFAAQALRVAFFPATEALYAIALAFAAVPLFAFVRGAAPVDRPVVRWACAVSGFMAAMLGLYVAMSATVRVEADEEPFFAAEAVLFSLAVYALMYLELSSNWLTRMHASRGKPPAPSEADARLLRRLRDLVESEKPHLDAALSMPGLARTLKVSPQTLSRLLNTNLGVSFNDYVNRLRIDEAVRVLSLPDGASRKIGSLAYDCGFNSPSVFYAAFKKFTGKTPTEFLKDRVPR